MITNVKTGETSYQNAVIGRTSSVERIMSDVYATVFYAVVVDNGVVKNIPVANDEFGAHHSMTVDATAEVKAQAFDIMKAQALDGMNREQARAVDEYVAQAAVVMTGREVTVVKGRKVKIGTEGRVFWRGDKGWGMSVGIELADGSKVFTSESNVKLTQPDEYLDLDFCTKVRDYSVAAHNAAVKRFFQVTGEMLPKLQSTDLAA